MEKMVLDRSKQFGRVPIHANPFASSRRGSGLSAGHHEAGGSPGRIGFLLGAPDGLGQNGLMVSNRLAKS